MPRESRRSMLRAAGALLGSGSLLALSGCSAPVGGETGDHPLSVVDTEVKLHGVGSEIEVTVQNETSERQSGTLTGQIDVDGGQTYTKSWSVSLPPEHTEVYDMYFEASIAETSAEIEYTGSAWIE